MNKINKKAGMSISIVLLVLATLILCSFALVTFYLREKSIKEKIYVTKFLEDVYSREETINFYINNILEKSVKGAEGDKSKIIENFTKELGNYKDKDGNFIMPELIQVEKQINENPDLFIIENGKVTAEFEIKIEGEVTDEKSGKELFSAVYTYRKTFEKEI